MEYHVFAGITSDEGNRSLPASATLSGKPSQAPCPVSLDTLYYRDSTAELMSAIHSRSCRNQFRTCILVVWDLILHLYRVIYMVPTRFELLNQLILLYLHLRLVLPVSQYLQPQNDPSQPVVLLLSATLPQHLISLPGPIFRLSHILQLHPIIRSQYAHL